MTRDELRERLLVAVIGETRHFDAERLARLMRTIESLAREQLLADALGELAGAEGRRIE